MNNISIKSIKRALKQNIDIKHAFIHALRPFSTVNFTDTDPSSRDFIINLPILRANNLEPIILCVQYHNNKQIRLTNCWYINEYQRDSIVVKKIAYAHHINVNYCSLSNSSRTGIVVSKSCDFSSLGKIIQSYVLTVIEIANYLQVNSYLDTPNTLTIQKLNS